MNPPTKRAMNARNKQSCLTKLAQPYFTYQNTSLPLRALFEVRLCSRELESRIVLEERGASGVEDAVA